MATYGVLAPLSAHISNLLDTVSFLNIKYICLYKSSPILYCIQLKLYKQYDTIENIYDYCDAAAASAFFRASC